ncbi:hypothetical protein DSO57_1021936 [Entomophthora muscae]|uniref:Uncharacterized protein n=1 Tax=Entomophthora muscae TaxID=34485 RepID=A0ACC2RHY4_9FUNG|nr:hypothetical protein DSO57_1021936 [Entomophthora muscae]
MDPDAIPERNLPDKEEVNKDLLHQVLAVNAVTERQAIWTEALSLRDAIETVSIPYYEYCPTLPVKLPMKAIVLKNWHKYYVQYKS